jgi:hypothetical protein
LSAYYDGKPHTRVARGLWFYEAAFRQAYVDLRWSFLVTALEALVHIPKERLADGKGKAGTTQVFVDRLLHFATLDHQLAISEQKLRDFYDERSTVAHGQVFSKLDQRLRELYDDLEEFSRRVLRKAIIEPGFAACFASDTQIQTTLPLRPRAPSGPPRQEPSSPKSVP